MKNNRDGPDIRFFMGRGSPGGDPKLTMHRARGDPGLYRQARDNLNCIVLIYSTLIHFEKLKWERYGWTKGVDKQINASRSCDPGRLMV